MAAQLGSLPWEPTAATTSTPTPSSSARSIHSWLPPPPAATSASSPDHRRSTSGNNAANTSTTDLAGTPRIQGGTIDLGAYEGAFVTYAHLGYTDPNGDANHNGITNFGDYAAGGNPSAPDDPSLRPKLIGNQLTFSFRDNAADIAKEFQKSTTLLPGSWMEMIETTDYTDYTCSTISGGRSLQTLTLTSTLLTNNPKLFFRQEFKSVP